MRSSIHLKFKTLLTSAMLLITIYKSQVLSVIVLHLNFPAYIRSKPFEYSLNQPEQDLFVVSCLAISACNVKELRMQVRFQKVCYGKGARK